MIKDPTASTLVAEQTVITQIKQDRKPMFSSDEPETIFVRKVQLRISPQVNDLSKLDAEDLSEIVAALNKQYEQIEKSDHPAAGYELYFKEIAKGKRPIEVILEVCGERPANDPLEMPTSRTGSCAFCTNDQSMPGYENSRTETAHVIKTLEGNPLSITDIHGNHFFDLPQNTQVDLLLTAIRTASQGSSRFTISSHVGLKGHQTFPHAHAHILASLGTQK